MCNVGVRIINAIFFSDVCITAICSRALHVALPIFFYQGETVGIDGVGETLDVAEIYGLIEKGGA